MKVKELKQKYKKLGIDIERNLYVTTKYIGAGVVGEGVTDFIQLFGYDLLDQAIEEFILENDFTKDVEIVNIKNERSKFFKPTYYSRKVRYKF